MNDKKINEKKIDDTIANNNSDLDHQEVKLEEEEKKLDDSTKAEKTENLEVKLEDETKKKILNDPAVKEELKKQEVIWTNNLRESITAELSENYKKKINEIELKAQEKLTEKINELTEKNKEELEKHKKFLLEKHALGLINILDHFTIAVDCIESNKLLANYTSGFKMILNMFNNWLTSIGVEEIPIHVGDKFDPQSMLAIEKIDSELPNESVVKLVRKGYKMFTKVIRHASVITSNGSRCVNANPAPQPHSPSPTGPQVHSQVSKNPFKNKNKN